MAGTAVATPVAGTGQHIATNFQSVRPEFISPSATFDNNPRGHRPFHRPYAFRPRYPMNKGGEDDSKMYDGKRMRKAVHRRTVDYNPSVIKYLQNRVWQRDGRDEHMLQPDALYSADLVPPSALLDDPLNCVNTKFVRTSTNKFRCPIFCLTWTPEGRRLVTGASSGEFTLWNGLTFNFETILQAHETAVRAMRWSHSDGWMVTADHAGYIKYWQSNMNNVKMFQAHKEPIRGISFCPTDSKFASCSDDGTVRVWDFMRCHEERILRGHGADVRCVDWHPQKSLLASGSKDNQQPVKLWDPRTGNSLATIHAHKHTVMDLKWHHNGNWMLTASRDHLLKLFDTRNLKEELQTFKGHKREATAIGWHPVHEGLFASGSADGALMFWMVGCDHEVGGMEQAHEGMVWSLAWHPMGHILASGSNDHATKFWTRNRPGDEMRDKYNLNLLPIGFADQHETADAVEAESVTPNLPGMGLEHGVAEHLQVKEDKDENELPSIPGLNWEEDSILLKAEERAANKKVPYARPVPKMFEQAWAGEIDIEQIKKEQEQKQQQQQQQAKQASNFNQPTLLLAQQMLGAALTGALRQQLAGLPGGHMLLRPGGQIMLGQAMMGALRPGGVGPGGPMLLIPGAPGLGPRLPGPGGGQQQQQLDANASGTPGGPGSKVSTAGPSSGEPSSTENQNQNGQAEGNPGSSREPNQNTSDILQNNGPQVSTAGPPQAPVPEGGPPGRLQGHPQGQMVGAAPQNQMGGPPQSHMGGPPQGHILGPLPPQTQMGDPSQGPIIGSPLGSVPGPPQGPMTGPPQGPMTGPPQGQIGGPHQGPITGPPQGQMGGPAQGPRPGPLQGPMTGPPQGPMGGPPQGPRGGPPQGPRGVPPQGPRGAPPQGPRGGPPQGPMTGPPQIRMGGPPPSQMGGPQQGVRDGRPQGPRGAPLRGPPPNQIGGPPQAQMRMRPPVPPGQQPGSRPQRPPYQGQGPSVDQRGADEGGEHEEMDTDERYNVHGPVQSSQESADMDQDFRAPRGYHGPAGPFSGEDQDLRQQGPPPPPLHRPQMYKPGPPRHPPSQAGQYDDYGDMDERMGDTGDYDYRIEGAGRRGRGRAPYREGYKNRHGSFANYDLEDNTSADYDNGGGWDYDDQGESYNDSNYEDYGEGYGEDAGYEEHGERSGPPQPPNRKRAWEEGPGQDRGRGRGRGWNRGAAGDS